MFKRAIAVKISSPGEGVYSIHPRQMMTRKPLNINDDDLIDGVIPVEKPMCYPTDMAYFLQRCRLGEISRRIADRTSLIMAYSSDSNREDIMDIDTEFQMIINDMPKFLSMSEKELMATYNISQMRAAAIFQQGNTARFLLHSQRCRLHLPYFTRGFVDMSYSQSKEICLESARLVIRCERVFERAPQVNQYRFCSLFIGILRSGIVLLVDFCINRSSPYRDRQRKDVAEVFQLLQEGKKQSEAAANFVESFIQILNKHNLGPPRAASTQAVQNERATHNQLHAPLANGTGLGGLYESIHPSLTHHSPSSGFTIDTSTNMTADWNKDDVDLTSYFDQVSQNFEMGTDVDNVDWDSIISDFGLSIVGAT
jgi:hypothetical protein